MLPLDVGGGEKIGMGVGWIVTGTAVESNRPVMAETPKTVGGKGGSEKMPQKHERGKASEGVTLGGGGDRD